MTENEKQKYNRICLDCINTCKWLISEGRIMQCPWYNIPREDLAKKTKSPKKKSKK